jgi:hypothetical protein
MRCTCGHENPAGYQFCGSCGRPSPAGTSSTQVLAQPMAAPVDAREVWQRGRVPARAEPAESPRPRPRARRAIPHDDMTRYLSAAVNFDSGLAKAVINHILEEPHRAIASTPGVDLVTVLKYALAANRRRVIRDVLLFIYLCIMILTIVVGFITVPVFLFISWMTILSERHIRFYGQSSRPLRPGEFGTAQPRSPGKNSYAARQLTRVEEADRAGNVTVYSAFSPFVGYGTITSSWSFAVDVTAPRREARPRAFTVQELYEHVEAGLGDLDMPGMEFGERLFVNGRDISDDPRFLQTQDGPPVTSVREDLLTSLMADPEERARPYLTISVAGWQGELVTTTFVRFLLSRTDLFVEAAQTAVGPLRPVFKAVDDFEMAPVDGEFAALVKTSFRQTIPLLLRSGSAVIYEMRRGSRREARRRRLGRRPDYGALISVREAAADTEWQRYFQVFDHARYIKVIEQRIFHSLIEFLRAHNVDVSNLVARAETIINNNTQVTNNGGVQAFGNATVNAGQVAGGAGAKATGWSMPFRSGDSGGNTAT